MPKLKAIDWNEEREKVEEEILHLERLGKPVPVDKERYRLRLLANSAPEDKRLAFETQLAKLLDSTKVDQAVITIDQVPPRVLSKIARFKRQGLKPYDPRMTE